MISELIDRYRKNVRVPSAILCNWLVSLNTTVLDHMLDYPGSLIHPITQIRVMVHNRDRRTQVWSKGQIYEDLWFSNGRPLNLFRDTVTKAYRETSLLAKNFLLSASR
ncbi:hypothetical protein BH10CYA1_BH10CYA1_28700 [soil metagenome]